MSDDKFIGICVTVPVTVGIVLLLSMARSCDEGDKRVQIAHEETRRMEIEKAPIQPKERFYCELKEKP